MKLSTLRLFFVFIAIALSGHAHAQTGACCYVISNDEWTCLELEEAICESTFLDGTWQGEGTICDDVNCEPVLGACCFSGTCQIQTELECTTAGGILWTEGDDCDDENNPCGEQVACCFGSSCDDVWLWYCTENGGEIDDDGFCSPDTCKPLGACCYGIGWCDDGTTALECQKNGGNWFNGVCEDAYCMRGTCCLRDGGCDSNLFYEECYDGFGIWQGYPLDGCNDELIECPTQILVVGPIGTPDVDYNKIHQAVVAADDGAVIWVMPGIYTRNNSSQPVINTMSKAITIRGWGSRDECIVDGLGTNRCVLIDPGVSDERPRLSTLTFRNGLADEGGGLRSMGPVMVEHCRFESNTATTAGGAAWFDGDGAHVRHCLFDSNTSPYGGGLYAKNGSIDIQNADFENNAANERGGAIRLFQSSASIQDCTFTGNTAVQGGAMHLQGECVPEIENCQFSMNTASSLGGAVCNNGGADALYTDCTFSGNAATGENGGQGSGGAIYNDTASPMFDACRIRENTAVVYGGGMYNWYATPVIENNSFSSYNRIQDNTANAGGGIFSFGDGPSLDSMIVCANLPDQIGGSWSDLGDNCLAESCESNDGDHTPDDCQEAGCTGDTDNSGDVNIDDLLVVLAEFANCTGECSGDVDDNGSVDIDDLLIVIGTYGPCP